MSGHSKGGCKTPSLVLEITDFLDWNCNDDFFKFMRERSSWMKPIIHLNDLYASI
jgi:hypothetical protein